MIRYGNRILNQLKKDAEWIERSIALGIVERDAEVTELLKRNYELQRDVVGVSRPGVYTLNEDGKWVKK